MLTDPGICDNCHTNYGVFMQTGNKKNGIPEVLCEGCIEKLESNRCSIP